MQITNTLILFLLNFIFLFTRADLVAPNCQNGLQKSVLFVLDGSASVGQTHFDAAISFIQTISDYLDISSQEVALEQYGSSYVQIWEGGSFTNTGMWYQSRNEFYSMLNSVTYLNSGIATCSALDFANYNILPFKEYPENSVVLITSNFSPDNPEACADKLRLDQRSTVYVIALGDVTQNPEAYAQLKGIANEPSNDFLQMGQWETIMDYSSPVRYQTAQDIANRICGQKYCTCKNGEPAVDECPGNGIEYCQDCNWGYSIHPDLHVCIEDPFLKILS